MTPQCDNFRQQIAEYIEGDLTKDQSTRLEKHLETCLDCKEYFQAYVLDDKLLIDFTAKMTPVLTTLSDSVADQLNSQKINHISNRTIKLRFLRYAAAAIILFTVGMSLYALITKGRSNQQKIAYLNDDGENITFIESSNDFIIAADIQKQLVQVRELIDSGQTELLESVLDMPNATTDTKITAAEFLASQNNIRGIDALEELTAEQRSRGEQSDLTSLASVPYVMGDDETDLMVNKTEGNLERSPVMGITATGPVVDKLLDGKKAIVRIYDNWKKDPEVFRTAAVEIKNRMVDFGSLEFDAAGTNGDEVGTAPVVAVFGQDQTDPNVAESMSNCVFASTYQKDVDFTIPSSAYGKRSVIFNDAYTGTAVFDNFRVQGFGGSPIPEADVKVYLVANNKARICLGEFKTATGGDLAVPYIDKHNNSDTRFILFEFIVSQPDYGTAKVSHYLYPNGTVAHISLPLVKSDSELSLRAVKGAVVDPAGFPVAGADISCSNVRTLGEGLINSTDSNITVLTDEKGRFRLYVLSRDRSDERGSLIPPKSTYSLRIEAPAQTDLLPLQVALVNDNEHFVTMNRGDVLRYFAFHDDEGLITDPEKLGTLNIYVTPPDGSDRITLYYDHIKDGAFVPYGTYRAVMYYNGQETQFEPMQVVIGSDELLVFDLPDVLEYHGRVVNGITGEPMQDIIVFAENGGKEKSLAQLADQDWDLLHYGDPENEDIYGPLDECYDIKQIVKTDMNGEFTMQFRKGEVYGIYAVEQYFLPMMQRDMNLEVDEENRCEIPTLKLFPAAKLAFKLTIENPAAAYNEDMTVRSDMVLSGDILHISDNIWPRWSISPTGNPEWISDLLQCDNRRDKFIEYAKWMRPSEGECFLFVPADTALSVKLDPSSDTLSPMYLDVSALQQGQVKNMGEIMFSSRFQIALKIVDPQGNLREGVPIRRKVASNAWDVVHNSDENGQVFFYVDPYSINTFGIHYRGDDQFYLETLDIEIFSRQETPAVFLMEVSDQMLKLLFE